MKTGTQFLLNVRMKTAMIYPKYDSLVKTGIMKKSAKKRNDKFEEVGIVFLIVKSPDQPWMVKRPLHS